MCTKNFVLQASYTALNMMLNSLNDEARLALLCENFAYLNSEERAGILFTTSDDVKYFLPSNIFCFKIIFRWRKFVQQLPILVVRALRKL